MQISEVLAKLGPAPAEVVRAAVGCTLIELRAAISDADRRMLIHESAATERYSDEAILNGLRAMSAARALELGQSGPARVPTIYWDEHRDPEFLPSAIRIMQRFSTWNDACLAAGIPMQEQQARSGPVPRWTDEDCARWVAAFLAAPDGGSTYAEFSDWVRTQHGAPGGQTVRNRLGGWNEARRAAAKLRP